MINYLDTDDNIVALATADGLASIAVVRVSGKRLGGIYKLIAKKKSLPRPNSIYFNKIYSPVNCEHLDDGLISYFEGSNSFTGESVLEINCHGGEIIAQSILNMLYVHGVQAAFPGEFSYRAFLNNKIDLVEAEAISSLIHSPSQYSNEIIMDHLNKSLTKKIFLMAHSVIALSLL